MALYDRLIIFVFATVVLFGTIESRAVNISNTWMLPEEGFPVFYRYFRDRISWYEADAVCQFHHANLVTADTSSKHDAIRAYLKELDITEKVWIGLSKTSEKPKFSWTDFKPLTGEGHWQEALPAGDSQSLCAVMDPAADFLWRPLPCGGPEVAAFICELPIPLWASGPKGCLLTELPSLTVLYIPEQSALELTSDCGLDGTKRIACKGNADREEILRQLTCVISNEDIDEDKSTRTSSTDFYETSTSDENSLIGKTWSSNTISADYGTPTRHRRETEDTLSPVSTKSSFKEDQTINITWRDIHREKTVLTTQHVPLGDHATPTPATIFNITTADLVVAGVTVSKHDIVSNNNGSDISVPWNVKQDQSKFSKNDPVIMEVNSDKSDATTPETVTTESPKKTQVSTINTKGDTSNMADGKLRTEAHGVTVRTTTQEGNIEEYPSAISQGQLFSIIENGTLFDIIELNETDQELQPKTNKIHGTPSTITSTGSNVSTEESTATISSIITTANAEIPTKKYSTKKPIQSTRKYTKSLPRKKDIFKNIETLSALQSVRKPEENLTKEFEMLPDIKDHSVKLNRTFRKDLPLLNDDQSEQLAPKILNFNISNALDAVETPHELTKTSTMPPSTNNKEPNTNNSSENNSNAKNGNVDRPSSVDSVESRNPIDPRIYMLNQNPNVPSNNESELVSSVKSQDTKEDPKIIKEDFLPKSLLGKNTASSESTLHPGTSEGYIEHPFPSDEPKKINRHRNLHANKQRKFYPYFFSRMLG